MSPFKKKTMTWTPELHDVLIECYREALRLENNDTSVISACLEQFQRKTGLTVTNVSIKSKLTSLRKQFPERLPTSEHFKQRSASSQPAVQQSLMVEARKNRKWSSAEVRRLWEIASSVFRAEELRKLSGFYKGQIGRHSGLYELLRDTFVADQKTDEDISIKAVEHAFKRSMQKYGEIEPNPLITAEEVEEATAAEIIKDCFEAENEFAKNKVFDACCAVCSALLWGEIGHGHKDMCVAETSRADVTYHFNPRDLLPFQFQDRDNNTRWFLCRSCAKHPRGSRVPEVFNFYAPNGNAKRPSELCPNGEELSMHAKQQLSMVRFMFCVTKHAVPQAHSYHINKGYVKPKSKPTSLNFHMYGFVSNNPKLIQKLFVEKDRVIIRNALIWLRKNNHLYKQFFANIETIYRFFITTKIDFYNIPFAKYASGKDLEHGVEADLLHVLASSELPDLGNEDEAYVGAQHCRDAAKTVFDITRVKYTDPNREAKAYPYLLPYGNGGFSKGRGIARNDYIKNRLCNSSRRFRSCRHWTYYQINEQGLEVYYFTKRKNIASNIGREKNVTAADVIRGKKERDSEVGIAMRQTIPGTAEFWHCKLYDLMAMVSKLATLRPTKPHPDLFVTITLNEGWAEVQALVNGGVKQDPHVPENPLHRTYTQRKSATHMPFEVTVAAQKRLNFILREIRNKRIFGTVNDYVVRAEYQNRGAIHWHILFWVSDMPSNVVSAEMPRGNDEESQHLRLLVQTFQIHRCLNTRCRLNRKSCKYGFPYQRNLNLHLDKSGKRYTYVRREDEDRNVVPYNAALLILAKAHVNVQLCTQKEMYSYLMRYQMKFFAQKVQVANTTEKDNFVRMRDVSIMEAHHQALQFASVISTREVIYLPTDYTPNTRVLKSDAQIRQLYEQDPDSEAVFCNTKIEHYMQRPEELEEVSYTEFYERYRFIYSTDENRGWPNHLNPKQRVVERNREACTRYYLKSVMKSMEEYCLQQLILHIPFRCLDDLFSDKNPGKSATYECATTYKDHPKMKLENKEQMAMHYLDSAKHKMFSFEELQKQGNLLVEQGFLDTEVFKSWLSDLEEETVLRSELGLEEDFMTRDDEEPVIPTAEDIQKTKRILVGKQLHIYEKLEKWCKDPAKHTRPPFRLLLTGGAGVGKTTLVKALVELFKHYNVVVQTLATTGVASRVCGGTTVHHFFKFGLNLRSKLDPSGLEARLIRVIEVLIIDEVSMMSGDLFLAVDRALQVYENPNMKAQKRLFGGRCILLVGDPAQLPVINATGLWQQPKFYEHFEVYNLDRVMRTTDRQFMGILNKIRVGYVDEEVEDFLRSKEVPESDLEPQYFIEKTDAVYIVPKKERRDEFNNLVLQQLSENSGRDIEYFDAHNIQNNSEVMSEEQVRKCLRYKKSMLPEKLELVVGCKVILLKNICAEQGWVNGTIAFVKAITKDTILIQDAANLSKYWKVTRFTEDISPPGDIVKCERIQFPLDLAYSLTMHKTQGMTLKRVAVNMKDPWETGQVYVAISRCSDPRYLRIVNYTREKIILGEYYRQLLQWIDRVDMLGKAETKRPMPLPPPTRQNLLAEPAKLKDLHSEIYDKYHSDSDNDEVILTDEEIEAESPVKQASSSQETFEDVDDTFKQLAITPRKPEAIQKEVAQISQTPIKTPLKAPVRRVRERAVQFLNFSLRKADEATIAGADVEDVLLQLSNTEDAKTFETEIFNMCFWQKISNDIPQNRDENLIKAAGRIHTCFPRKFTLQWTKPDGNCFWYALSQAVFGDDEFFNVIKVACLFAFRRHLHHFKRLFGDSCVLRIWREVATDKFWATDDCYVLAALALARPLHVFSIGTLQNNTVIPLVVGPQISKLSDDEFLQYCATESRMTSGRKLFSFIYSSPWARQPSVTKIASHRAPIRLLHSGNHFVNMVPVGNHFNLLCGYEHYTGTLSTQGVEPTEDQKEEEFFQNATGVRYRD